MVTRPSLGAGVTALSSATSLRVGFLSDSQWVDLTALFGWPRGLGSHIMVSD